MLTGPGRGPCLLPIYSRCWSIQIDTRLWKALRVLASVDHSIGWVRAGNVSSAMPQHNAPEQPGEEESGRDGEERKCCVE